MRPEIERIEKDILEEESMLAAVVDLLNRKTAFSDWPDDMREVFLLALKKKESRRGDQEAWKAFRTARHLRIDRDRLPPEPANPSTTQRRCAERIRADLPRLVKLKAGSHLTAKT